MIQVRLNLRHQLIWLQCHGVAVEAEDPFDHGGEVVDLHGQDDSAVGVWFELLRTVPEAFLNIAGGFFGEADADCVSVGGA